MSRFALKIVFRASTMRRARAGSPTRTAPEGWNEATLGMRALFVVSSTSARARPLPTWATTVFDVPRSIPTTAPLSAMSSRSVAGARPSALRRVGAAAHHDELAVGVPGVVRLFGPHLGAHRLPSGGEGDRRGEAGREVPDHEVRRGGDVRCEVTADLPRIACRRLPGAGRGDRSRGARSAGDEDGVDGEGTDDRGENDRDFAHGRTSNEERGPSDGGTHARVVAQKAPAL